MQKGQEQKATSDVQSLAFLLLGLFQFETHLQVIGARFLYNTQQQ